MHTIDTGRSIAPLVRAGSLAASASLLLALSACANLHTIHRTTDLPDDGKAVHLDAAQRVIHVTKNGKACAEPTPDALQSYASAFGSALNAGCGWRLVLECPARQRRQRGSALAKHYADAPASVQHLRICAKRLAQ